MKKFISTLLSFAIVICMCPILQASAEVTLRGNGTSESPYLIGTADELKTARDLINANANGEASAFYELTADINLNNEQWIPIAPVAAVTFSGTFDGKNHVIKNINLEMTNNNTSNYATSPALGFFGRIHLGTVKNLGLDTVSIINNSQWVNSTKCSWNNKPHSMGAFAGYINSDSSIQNCYVKNATVEQNAVDHRPANGVGGFFGGCGNQIPTFINCYVYNAFLQSKCKSTGERDLVGGFVGSCTPKTSFTNCYTAKITTNDSTTALTSFYAFGRTGTTVSTIENCYAENVDIACNEGKGVYDGTKSMGDTGVSKADLVTNMTKFQAFGVLSTINDGYPCLIYEDASLIPTPAPTLAPIDITNVDGAIKYFGQNFDDESISEGDRVVASMGFSNVNDTAAGLNVQYFVEHDDITNVPETSNRVMRVVPKIVQARATVEQYEALLASDKSVQWGTNTYKVVDFVDGYYIASKCTTRNAQLYWIKKSSVVDGVLTSTVSDTDYGTTFYTDPDGTITNISAGVSGASLYFTKPTEDAGKYAIQFDYAYPDNGNLRCGEEFISLSIDGSGYNLREYGIHRGYGFTARSLDFGTNPESLESGAKHTYVAKPDADADIPHYFLATDDYTSQLTDLSTRVDKTWYKVMAYIDMDNGYYSLYLDGYPMYFKAENGGYSCRVKLKESEEIPRVYISTNRLCIYNDHAPVFDNFLGYYSLGSDEETVTRTLENLELPYIDTDVISSDIVFDENESRFVTWSFSDNAFVIDSENPLIARYNAPFGKGTTKVTLTATCNYGAASGTRTFELDVKNRAKYEVDTVLIKDASGNRVYRPVDNSVIESVSYTANSNEAAEMYLAVYESDGRLKSATKRTAQDGKCTFNQAIDADETYKVFLWENGTIKPLAIPETGKYPESNAPKIFVIGDSIAHTYTTTSKDIRGWGQYLDTAFNGVVVDNTQAIEGRTTKYALAEDRLKYVLDNSSEGDYLFIMLAHNDEKLSDYYGATIDEYKAIFEQMINSSRDKGVTPVLVTSVARPQWNNDGTIKDSHGDYRRALYAVAEKTGTALIDVDKITMDVLDDYTYTTYKTLGYFGQDTHTTEKGAKWVVEIIADELAKMNLPISEFLK